MPEHHEGERIAIVGAGPAGCLMALALLQAAEARRQAVDITLYGAGPLPSAGWPLLADAVALARLAALGIPIPAGRSIRSYAIRVGREEQRRPVAALALPLGALLAILRAAAAARGATLVPHQARALAPTPGGGWRFRVQGAPERVDHVILACGAGAPIAAGIPGHRPPPTWRCHGALLRHPPSGAITRLLGGGDQPDLWLLPHGEGTWLAAAGPRLDSRELGRALLHASLCGELPEGALQRHPIQRWVPAGVALPGLPTVGAALGGPPEGPSLARLLAQVQHTAAALLEGGSDQALRSTRQEARRLTPRVRGRLHAHRSWHRFAPEAKERVLRRERRRAPERRPLGSLLLGGKAGLWRLLRVFLALCLATLALAWQRLRGRNRRRAPGNRRGAAATGQALYIVEDEAAQAEGLASWLGARGWACRIFPDALQAAAAAAREPPAAALVDLSLPWIDGSELCRALKAGAPSTPIVLLTALPLPMARAGAREAEADALLAKPVDLQELLGALRRLTSSPGRASAPPPGSSRRPSSG